jgi:ssRNA-specific RNase YbeY (16S rRNA maturation enzyme)
MFKGETETYQWFANIAQKKTNLKEKIVNLRKEQYQLHVINVPQINLKLIHAPFTKTQSATNVLTAKTDNSE